ncbi:UDP-N-acetylmuramate--L-alanine ligase [Christensenellaceae bacterium OttesenSCG-928-K19]|nr:UDP-N-acetylmuramate--L-alanine ligase [Christensenellaceae bacterium OttesenSCG-928-K19]
MATGTLSDYQNKRIHFIGIGGCSMSGLAQILASRGFEVTGSDVRESAFTEQLKKRDIPYYIGHDEKHVHGAGMVVYSAAIKPYNPEYAYAAAHDIPMLERSKLLGLLSGEYDSVVCIAGCHGKTTITSMLALIMQGTEEDATVHVGGMVEFLEGGVKLGNGNAFITEACEYVRSFLTLHPSHILVNNIDDDHLDCYRDIDDIFNTFVEFIQKQDENGILMLNASDELAMRLKNHAKGRVITYNQPDESDWYLDNVMFDELGCGAGDVIHKGKNLTTVKLTVPGLHNLKNALAAIAFANEVFGANVKKAAAAMKDYKLAGRRFELIGERNGVRMFHDYAHHPSEIAACLEAAKLVPHKKLWAIFQCNSYTRARTLLDKYATCFHDADEVLMPDIYPGRDTDTQGIHSLDVVAAINKCSYNCLYIPTFEEIKEYLHKNWTPGDIVITLGSGDVNRQQMIFLRD